MKVMAWATWAIFAEKKTAILPAPDSTSWYCKLSSRAIPLIMSSGAFTWTPLPEQISAKINMNSIFSPTVNSAILYYHIEKKQPWFHTILPCIHYCILPFLIIWIDSFVGKKQNLPPPTCHFHEFSATWQPTELVTLGLQLLKMDLIGSYRDFSCWKAPWDGGPLKSQSHIYIHTWKRWLMYCWVYHSSMTIWLSLAISAAHSQGFFRVTHLPFFEWVVTSCNRITLSV